MNTTIITDKLLHGGMASGKIDGKTIFISGALPQEEVSISITSEKNLRSIPHSSYGQSGSQWAAAVKNAHFDAVLIDPPRSGMEKEVRQWLSRSSIPLIISLSCDPVTHARDCAELVKNGYEIESLYALDYYPQTSHVESLSICIKK